MVPPTHGADLEDAETAWAEHLSFILGLNTEAVVIQLIAPDDALAPALIELLLAQTPPRPLRVAFDVVGLYDAPEGARVVLVAPERSARALNLHRPVVRTRRMHLLLWCTPKGAFELKGTAPDMNSWVSHRLHLPAAWPPRVAEALLGVEERGEALTLLGPASPAPGFTTVQANFLEPEPLAAAIDAGPVWLTGAQDALDVFTALAIWAERGKHGLVLHDPPVVVDAVPHIDAAPAPWAKAAEACATKTDADLGVHAATLGLDPAALGLPGVARQRVENPRFVDMLAQLRAGKRPIGDAEALSLTGLAARWRRERPEAAPVSSPRGPLRGRFSGASRRPTPWPTQGTWRGRFVCSERRCCRVWSAWGRAR
ncbi:MAG: hypothetical protein IPN01_26610 [Deltaproteobacteria bacterium]|nr:hypothetical protein [Deltaproteobacteria bacterium]